MGEALEHLNKQMQQLLKPDDAGGMVADAQAPPLQNTAAADQSHAMDVTNDDEDDKKEKEEDTREIAMRIADSWTGMIKHHGYVNKWSALEIRDKAKVWFYKECYYWASADTRIAAARIIEERLKKVRFWGEF